MKRWYFPVVALVLFAALIVAAVGENSLAAQGEPGSADDPLVAKSYVDKLTAVQVLELEAGETLRAEAGAEIILRAGKAVAVTGPQGGIADLTAGRDIQAGEVIPANHLLLVPRSDGRGLTTSTPVVLLVRGGVTVE
ncbi:MAG: hypothetical protein ACOX2S_08565 [bacterium]